MKVLLTQTIDRIGIVGDVIDVSEGFARNYLLPKKLAIQPTSGNIKQLEQKKIAYENQQRALREEKEKLVTALAGHEITVSRAANDEGHLFGSVSRRDIAEELQKAGFNITPEDVRLDEPLRRVDTYTVAVHLSGDLKADVKVWITREKTEGQPEAPKAEAAPAETPA